MIKSIFLTMIQRVQSFYLFLVAALVLSMLFMPLAGYSNADGNWQFLAMGVYTMADPAQMVLPAWPIAILIALMGLLACISIFLYKNRILQMKFCLFNGLMLLAFYPIFFLYLCSGSASVFCGFVGLEYFCLLKQLLQILQGPHGSYSYLPLYNPGAFG